MYSSQRRSYVVSMALLAALACCMLLVAVQMWRGATHVAFLVGCTIFYTCIMLYRTTWQYNECQSMSVTAADGAKTLLVGVCGVDGIWPVALGTLVADIYNREKPHVLCLNTSATILSYGMGALVLRWLRASPYTTSPFAGTLGVVALVLWIVVHHGTFYGVLTLSNATTAFVWAQDEFLPVVWRLVRFATLIAPVGAFASVLWFHSPVIAPFVILAVLVYRKAVQTITDATTAQIHKTLAERDLLLQSELSTQRKALLEAREQEVRSLVHDTAHFLDALQSSLDVQAMLLASCAVVDKASICAQNTSMIRAVANIDASMQELLDVAKMDNDILELTTEMFVAQDIVEYVVDVLRPQYDQHGIALRIDMPEQDIGVRCDGKRISRVLFNVATNAAVYLRTMPVSHARQVCFRVSQEVDNVIFSVQDNGPGISSQDVEKVGQAFTRLDNSAGTSGCGIGMAFAIRILQVHGGTMRIQSAGVGLGATFDIVLPQEPRETGCEADMQLVRQVGKTW